MQCILTERPVVRPEPAVLCGVTSTNTDPDVTAVATDSVEVVTDKSLEYCVGIVVSDDGQSLIPVVTELTGFCPVHRGVVAVVAVAFVTVLLDVRVAADSLVGQN